jgi:hypothetical protein
LLATSIKKLRRMMKGIEKCIILKRMFLFKSYLYNYKPIHDIDIVNTLPTPTHTHMRSEEVPFLSLLVKASKLHK